MVNANISLFVWNCQRCAHSRFPCILREYNVDDKPDVVYLLETWVTGRKAEEVIVKLGFHSSHRVEAKGFSGGIWIGSKNTVRVNIIQSHPQFVFAQLNSDNYFQHPLIVFVYGSPNPAKRRTLWEILEQTIPNRNIPWMAIGDFNALLSEFEKKGSKGRDAHISVIFWKAIIYTIWAFVDLLLPGKEVEFFND